MFKNRGALWPIAFWIAIGALVCVVVFQYLAPAGRSAGSTTATATIYQAPPPPALRSPDGSPPAQQLIAEGSRTDVQQAFGALTERQLSDGRHFIQFNVANARSLQLYDSFEIPLDPTSGPATGTIGNVSEFEGSKRISGKLAGTGLDTGQDQVVASDDDGVFSITLSSDGSYAAGNFTTGGKSYSLESRAGAGWITNPDTGASNLHHSADGMH